MPGGAAITVQVELDSEAEARLTTQAVHRGVAPEQYAREFLRNNLPSYVAGTGKLLPGDVDKMSKVMSAGAENLPVLPPAVNNSESYYEDRW
jgi:hypothetical protein